MTQRKTKKNIIKVDETGAKYNTNSKLLKDIEKVIKCREKNDKK